MPAAAARRPGIIDHLARAGAVAYLAALLGLVVTFKAAFAGIIGVDPLFGIYGIVVCSYIVSRFE